MSLGAGMVSGENPERARHSWGASMETPAPESSLPGVPSPSESPNVEAGHHSPELPYPEAPLASRKADLSERGRKCERRTFDAARASGRNGAASLPRSESSAEPYSTPAENQAEALAVERHQERKHDGREVARRLGADPKPPPRYIDPEALRQFHAIGHDCLSCGYYRCSAHHLVKRSQGGDDVRANLIPLCGVCHGVLHDGGRGWVWNRGHGTHVTPERVRNRIGQFLTSEAGEDHLNYVRAKLGTGAAAFLERYGVEDE